MAARSYPPQVCSTAPGTVGVLDSSVLGLMVCAIAIVCIGHDGLSGVAASHTLLLTTLQKPCGWLPRGGVGLS